MEPTLPPRSRWQLHTHISLAACLVSDLITARRNFADEHRRSYAKRIVFEEQSTIVSVQIPLYHRKLLDSHPPFAYLTNTQAMIVRYTQGTKLLGSLTIDKVSRCRSGARTCLNRFLYLSKSSLIESVVKAECGRRKPRA